MNTTANDCISENTGSPAPPGRVASLHLHPEQPGGPLQTAEFIDVVAMRGILGNPRYFDRLSRMTGKPTRRQISLIEREQIAEHAAVLGLEAILPGAVRANVETQGVNLVTLIGRQIQIGEAVLLLYEPRLPCSKMDAICAGLRALMADNRQGVMAEVIQPGRIQVGDSIRPIAALSGQKLKSEILKI